MNVRPTLVMWIAGLLVACGGGGGGGASDRVEVPSGTGGTAAPPATMASAPTPGMAAAQPLVTLSSDAADYVGGSGMYSYDTSSAAIRISVRGSHLMVSVDGQEHWTADFQLPGNLSQLQPGSYVNLARYPFQTKGAGALQWSGQGRACNTVTGSLVINSVSYQAGVLKAIDLNFEQHCEGAAAALRGQLRIDAEAMAQLTVPQNPLPDHPVVALNSDVGDYIGGGALYAYDGSNAQIGVTATAGRLSVTVSGDQRWSGDFQLPGDAAELRPGSYIVLARSSVQTPGAASLNWSGEGRGCSGVTGSMLISSVRYSAGVLSAIDMNFEQRCDGSGAALRGEIRWDANAVAVVAAPVNPIPSGLWTPPADAMPATGNAMVLSSAQGDYIGQGWTWWVGAAAGGKPDTTQGTATVAISEAQGLLKVSLEGAVTWSGEFKAMDSLTHLQAGYYGIVQRYPFHNPARGGMAWGMDHRACNALSGWFAVDSAIYLGDKLQSIDLRFTQYCDNAIAPLRGRIRWNLAGSSG